MQFLSRIDKQRFFLLLKGSIIIYFVYLIGGILHQYILKQKYANRFNVVSLIALEKLIIWGFGVAYNKMFLPKPHLNQNSPKIQRKYSIKCGLTIFISSLTNNYSMILVSYPIVIMFKSCNVLSVILIAIFFSRVTDKSLKLGKNKIIIALFVTIGMIMFKIFDPQAKQGEEKKYQYFGLGLLLISLLADGFLPDFQAEIKQKYSPQPTEMMVQINKWCFIISFIYLICTLKIFQLITFSYNHPLLLLHILAMTILGFFGQIYIYKLIKSFKQHIVPFIITTRKIFTVGISIIYYHHQTSLLQIIGILLVFVTVNYQFYTEVLKIQKQKDGNQIKQIKVQEFVEEVSGREIQFYEYFQNASDEKEKQMQKQEKQ